MSATAPDQLSRKGKFIVLSSPSGGGKSTIISRLLAGNENLVYSVSATTRQPRGGERNGESYWFLTREEFIKKRDRGDFLEWEEVYGDYYGTPKKFAEVAMAAGMGVLFDLDVKGALKFKENHEDSITIFLQPPSLEVLEERLRKRGTEDEVRLQQRLAEAKAECEQAGKFDSVVVNNDLEETVASIEKIIRSAQKEDERL